MTTITIHNMTDLYAVGFSSDNRTEVIQQYYSMWNLKATKGQLFWLAERKDAFFGYVLCKPEAFHKWLYDSSVRIYGNSVKSIKSIGKAKRAIRRLIHERKAALQYDNYVTYGNKNICVYSLANNNLKKQLDLGTETIDTNVRNEIVAV